MTLRRSAVFLERQTYRRRRLVDWIRVLPVIGLGLWLVPLFWPMGGEAEVSTSSALIYLFGVWLLLVIAAGFSARALRWAAQDPDIGETDRADGADRTEED
ncbi:hypothetical protein NBRC116601_03360 [Cognatishimia sp. WU-CL00825]|uniref:hypothetical protein n=1 Tax=Cognatishimia sp. WU-CL00825 TaxID=3127658 RepID=UPI003108FFC3